jgi:enoyl-CoA hydratase
LTEKLEYTDIIVEKKPPIGYIIINHPEKRNALVGQTIPQMSQAAFEMRDDPEIRVFIVKGAGDNFCSGFYQAPTSQSRILKSPEELPKSVEWVRSVKDEPWARYGRDRTGSLANPEGQSLTTHDLFFEEFWNNPTPSIAQVDSFCLGAGCWIINNIDVVYATPNAIFSYPPIRRGASVVLGIVPPWIMGRRMSMWMALTGEAITAEEAYNCGLVTKIIDEDKIEAEVNKLATSIARVPPATNMFSKRAINNYFEGLGISQAKRLGSAFVDMTENSSAPGHYLSYYANIDKYGFREANRMQLEKFGGFDIIQDKEVARLRAKKEVK